MSRVGIYGGSFNPPHTGHILAARELVERLELDELLIVPAANPPHKTLPAGSPSPEERFALCQAAFSGVPRARVCDLELKRQGMSYTVDTLTQLRRERPEDELILVMGSDMLLSFRSWYQPERILALAALAVVRRDESPSTWEKVAAECQALRRERGARILIVENRCVTVSSTTVRRLLAMKAPYCLDPRTEGMILEKGWYLTGADLKNLPFEELKRVSLSLHDEKRRPHVEGVSDTALALAEHWGADPEDARRAGILHDVTKALGPKEQLHICEKYAMMIPELYRQNPKLLHAKTGAVIAREVFGENQAVVQAINWHTTGRLGMSLLDEIIYIADYMEPNRCFPGVEILRKLVWTDMNAAMFQGLDQSVTLLQKQGRVIDPESLEAWRYYQNVTERSQTT